MIPFRTQRVATSVTNRILNIYAGLPPKPTPAEPSAPVPTPGGQELAAQLAAPKAPVDASPQDANAIGLAPLLK